MDNRLAEILCDPGYTMSSMSTDLSESPSEKSTNTFPSIALPTSFQLAFDTNDCPSSNFISNGEIVCPFLPNTHPEQSDIRTEMEFISPDEGIPAPSTPSFG